MTNKIFTVRKNETIASCNLCGAANYENKHRPLVDKINEVVFQFSLHCGHCFFLCDNCLKGLIAEVKAYSDG